MIDVMKFLLFFLSVLWFFNEFEIFIKMIVRKKFLSLMFFGNLFCIFLFEEVKEMLNFIE